MTWRDWSCLGFLVCSAAAYWYFVIDGRRDDMGHRVPLGKRLGEWGRSVWSLFWSSA